MDYEEQVIAAWRVIDRLRFASDDEIRGVRQALTEIRDRLEEVLA